MRATIPIVLAISTFLFTGCYTFRPSSGGGQISGEVSRTINANDIGLPPGYRIEPVARGLTFPTGATFDDRDGLFVVESGYCYGEVWTTPRRAR